MVRTIEIMWTAIGEIERFPDAKHLVGYSGLYHASKESGKSSWRGRITKHGRRDLRRVMVNAANHARQKHPYWKREFQRLEKRIGKPKAIVAIARKLLVVVWHVLTTHEADRRSDPIKIACAFFSHAYKVGVRNLPDGKSATEYIRHQFDRLGIGGEIECILWGTKKPTLRQSSLSAKS